jgi:Tfp pilus assembly protein PilV
MDLVPARLRNEAGFGLIELLMAMLMLNIGLLAVVAAFNSGIITLQRASRVTTASVLADQQMERYREIKYDSIRLETAAATTADGDTTYRNDSARSYPTAMVTGVCAGVPNECNPSRTAVGADKRQYRIDTYILQQTPTGGRPVKVVTVVVRDPTVLTRTYVRQASTFDQSTG